MARDETTGRATGSPVSTPDDVGRDGGDSGGAPFLQVANILLARRRLIAVVAIIGFVIAVAIGIILPREYTCLASLMPQDNTQQLSQLAGLAAQFGVNIPMAQNGESPDFYADLLRSEHLLKETVIYPYRFVVDPLSPTDTLQGDLVQMFDVHESDRPRSVEKAVEELQDRMNVNTHASTSVVDLSIQTHWPVLSQKIVERMLEQVNAFNLETRQTQAAAERRFLEGRVRDARDSLRGAEDSLQSFLEHNRSYQNSPELQFQYSRLQRRISLDQDVYTSLEQAFEQAKIQEVRNTPVITIVDPPEVPARPDRRHLFLKGLLGLIVGALLAAFWCFTEEALGRSRERDPGDYYEFRRLTSEAWRDVKDGWSWVRQRLRRRGGGRAEE